MGEQFKMAVVMFVIMVVCIVLIATHKSSFAVVAKGVAKGVVNKAKWALNKAKDLADISSNDCVVIQPSQIKDGNVLIFHAKWCGHCRTAKPHFKKAAENKNVILVDESCNQQLTKKYGVSGFPTILKVKGTGSVPYNGPRTSAGILGFLNS